MVNFRKAQHNEADKIWELFDYAISTRKADGSEQWQHGYPNRSSILNDIDNDWAYVLTMNNQIMIYGAVIFEGEPAYEAIQGNWLTEGKYVVVHRLAASKKAKGKGLATQFLQFVEKLAIKNNVHSLRIDTSEDNPAMLRIMEKLGYTYCGTVICSGPRLAFEKVI